MHKQLSTLLATGTILLMPVWSQAEVFQGEEIEVELISESVNVVPGETLWLALRLTPTEHWHTYSRWQGDSGEATRLSNWQLPEGAVAGDILFPTPTWLPFPGSELVTFSYNDEVFLPVPVQVPATLNGTTFDISVFAEWQVCEEICILGEATIGLTLPVQGTSLESDPRWLQAFATTRENLPLTLDEHAVQALFAEAGERISFSFQGAGEVFEGATDVWFFPESKRILKPGPLRDVVLSDGFAQVTQAKARRFLVEEGRIPGLLSVADADGRPQGYLVSAVPANAENLTSITALAANSPAGSGSSDNTGPGLLTVMMFALAGGLILNLMPCVFPVLSLKVLSLASNRGAAHREQRLHGLAYTAGIVVTFMALASILLALRAGGEAVGWAFQLQSPWFVALLIYLFFVMGLSLSGVFEFGTRFMGAGSSLASASGYKGSFFTGVLATVVASPCTAPFMGAALGFALSQSWVVAMLVFAFLGLGMALPFLILSFSPALMKFMPRPGAWMNTFKEFMAFPMYATVLWLLWVLGNQTGVNGMAAVVGSCLLLAFGLWLLQKRAVVGPFWRTANALVAALMIVGVVYTLQSPVLEARQISQLASESGDDMTGEIYEPFSSARLGELQAAGQPVFINMTAAWCITCLANEQTTLSSDRVMKAMLDSNITYLKGDWTNQDPEISRVLDEFNRPSVPLYVLYPGAGQKPVILPQILTPSIMLDAFSKI